MKSKFPLISIGLPVYNGEKYLRDSLDSLLAQSYENIELIISDNASNDGTKKICLEYLLKDKRIRYVCNESNKGRDANFSKVLMLSEGDYFMWASCDDIWDEKFVETGIEALSEYPNCDAWCCTIRNIDSYGRSIREYLGFSRFTSTANKTRDIIKYLIEPEVMGKPNIVMGLYKTDTIRKTFKIYLPSDAFWGGDTIFNLAFLARFNLIATDQVLLSKRVKRPTDKKEKVKPIIVKYPNRHIFPLDKAKEYIYENYKAVKDTPYKYLVLFIMILRVPIAFRNEYLTEDYYRKLLEGIKRKYSKLESYISQMLESVLPGKITEQYYKRNIEILEKKKQKEGYEIYRMASLYEKLKEYEKSRKLFNEITKTTKNKNLIGGSYFHIGSLEMISSNRERAIKYFKKVLEIIPEHKKAKKCLKILNT